MTFAKLVALLGCWALITCQNAAAGDSNSSVPTLLLFAIDGGITPYQWDLVYQKTIVASGVRNPNGCRIPVTWFTTCCLHGDDTGDCDTVQLAWRKGHELATHTMTHSEETATFSYSQWEEEIGGQRDWLTEECGVPEGEVVGFRAPNFIETGVMGEVLADLGFLYDSSLADAVYTQRAGLVSNDSFDLSACWLADDLDSKCAAWRDLPLWEVPAYRLPGDGKRMDPLPAANMSVIERFQADFQRKRGLGVPVPLNFHDRYLANSTTRGYVVDFLKWAFDQPGTTWALTFRQYIDWLDSPPGTDVASVVAEYLCDGGAPTQTAFHAVHT